jgi:hypothetical protein
MMFTPRILLLVIAIVLFVAAAAIPPPSTRIALTPAGLAFLAAALLVG